MNQVKAKETKYNNTYNKEYNINNNIKNNGTLPKTQ